MNDPFNKIVEELAKTTSPVSVTAAAGCGKTEAIVRAVANSNGRQLILTHTNAGVAALRSRLRKHSVPASKYLVETIASWLAKYALAYPSMSGFTNRRPQGEDWNQVYPAAQVLFAKPFVREVLQASYAGIFVDEYQDCTEQQHQIVLMMAEWLPVRVLGDPLQGIFKFRNQSLVDWKQVQAHFKPLPDLLVPYRWQKPGSNSALGAQLSDIRHKLLAEEPVDLQNYSEIRWMHWSQQQEKDVCNNALDREGTIVGIHQWPTAAHESARRMEGRYQSIEEMDCRDLMEVSRQIDGRLAQRNYQALVSCIKNFVLRGCAKPNPFRNVTYLQSEFVKLEQGDLSVISQIMRTVLNDPGTQVYRRELLTEMARSAQEFASGNYNSFEEAAYAARYKTRVNGRSPESRIISRTLLIKGLEFDHAIVLNADKLQNRENLYVAITRGSKSLTVLSQSPVISCFRNNQANLPAK